VILGSLREHIHIQFSKLAVDLGPAFFLQDGDWLSNARTTARAEGIKKLQATRPKADIADIQMFLAGFDAGEQYALDRVDFHPHNNPGAPHIQHLPLESLGSNLS